VVQTKFANKMIIFKGDVRVQKGYYFILQQIPKVEVWAIVHAITSI
jgi:hypothetical protein